MSTNLVLLLLFTIGWNGCSSAPFEGSQSDSMMPRLDGRIVGGVETNIEAIPFQVSLQRNYHFCGGSLIGKGLVLTAAHCVQGSAIYQSKVRIGASRSDSGGVLVGVKKVHSHPQYNSYTIDYDFAIIELDAYDATNITQSFVQLPPQNSDIADGTVVVVSGWGNTLNSSESTDVLRMVVVPKVNQATCAKAYNHGTKITARMLCAGRAEGGKDACQGDSGGPLAKDNVLWGVVSWGYGCAVPDYPGVYSRVAAVRNWIKRVSGV